MMKQHRFYTNHQQRVVEKAVKKASAGEAGKQPSVVAIHAYASLYGERATEVKVDGQKVMVVMGMALCEWEGCGSDDIEDGKMTWQPMEHFESDFLREYLEVLVDFKQWYMNSPEVCAKKLKFPLTRETRHHVICKTAQDGPAFKDFTWVKKHPSLKVRLNFK